MARKPKPILYSRKLSNAELEFIRVQVESSDTIGYIEPEMRDLIVAQWPDLLAKIKPVPK